MELRQFEINEEVEGLEDFNWPGWSLSENKFGGEFDIEARVRMVAGRDLFRLFVGKYALGDKIVEVGPFFSPTITVDTLGPEQSVVYVENDPHALKNMRSTYASGNQALVSEGSVEMLYEKSASPEGMCLKHLVQNASAILLSQVINYVDYDRIVLAMSSIVSSGTLVLINNVVDYGLPELFHPNRPRSIADTLSTLEASGAKLLDKEIVCAPRVGDKKRLLLCARF